MVILGHLLTPRVTPEIKRRLAIARTTSKNMLNIWKNRGLFIDLKLRFLIATVFSIATDGCEAWAPTKNDN